MALKTSGKTYSIQPHIKNMIMIAPIIIILLHMVLLVLPGTRNVSLWMMNEYNPVELLTFIVLVAGGVAGLLLALKTKKCGEKSLVYGFYTLFSLGLLFVAMEEVAWGQALFEFETLEAWRSINLKGETTIHNLPGLNRHTEILRLTFGAGGLLGVWLSFYPSFRKIGVPALLLPWFIIITVHASVDLLNDFVTIQEQFDYLTNKASEFIELFIAISAYLYVRLNSRIFIKSQN
jgi:hypothetical protein